MSLRIFGGFHEPQGMGYEATTDTLYIANGGDDVGCFRAKSYDNRR
jgi:hypothetical protein